MSEEETTTGDTENIHSPIGDTKRKKPILDEKQRKEILKRVFGGRRPRAHKEAITYAHQLLDSLTFCRVLLICIYIASLYSLFRLLFFQSERTFIFTNYIYFKLLGCIYLDAFVSYYFQILGLIGRHGIVPAQQTMDTLEQLMLEAHTREQLHEHENSQEISRLSPISKFKQIPSLFWFFDCSDRNLRNMCLMGIACSVCLILGIFPVPVLVATMYLIYLTMEHVSDVFLALQWDVLLLETGFLSIFFGMSSYGFQMMHILPSSSHEPNRVILFLLWYLLFRLMFASGLVKLASRDRTWATLEAMSYHYETQPIPGPLSHWIHNRSKLFHKIETLGTFLIELAIPWLMWGSRSMQAIAAFSFIFLNAAISTTGNYGFFNLHTMVLATLLFDDSMLDLFHIASLKDIFGYVVNWHGISWPSIDLSYVYSVPLFILIMVLSISVWNRAFRDDLFELPGLFKKIQTKLNPFYVLNPYGLFAVMTTERVELIIEGSNDGEEWSPYEFKYKPGDLRRRPPFILGHMPRLDWRMWFLPFTAFPAVPSWFVQFVDQLRKGNPLVTSQLDRCPFPANQPPKYIRVMEYLYKFTTRQELKEKGEYWKRTSRGKYIPFTLKSD